MTKTILDSSTVLFNQKEKGFTNRYCTALTNLFNNEDNTPQHRLQALIMLSENNKAKAIDQAFDQLHALIGELRNTKNGRPFLDTHKERINTTAERLMPDLSSESASENLKLEQFLQELGRIPTAKQRGYLTKHLERLVSFEQTDKLRDFFIAFPSFFQGASPQQLEKLHDKFVSFSVHNLDLSPTLELPSCKTVGNITMLTLQLKTLFTKNKLSSLSYVIEETIPSSASTSRNSSPTSSSSSGSSLPSLHSAFFTSSQGRKISAKEMPVDTTYTNRPRN